MRQKHFIDTHKGATPLFIIFLLLTYEPVDTIRLHGHIYLALHGTYGILWVLKSIYFPDRSWEKETGFMYGLLIWAGLSLYWISPYVIVSGMELGRIYVINSYWLLSGIICIYVLGIFFHFCSDMYKDTFIKLKPGTLISGGMFKRSRNINYFGEFLIYINLLSHHH